MTTDRSAIEALDALHIEVDALRAELSAALSRADRAEIALGVERDLVDLVAASPMKVPPAEVEAWRAQVVQRHAAGRALVEEVQVFLAENTPRAWPAPYGLGLLPPEQAGGQVRYTCSAAEQQRQIVDTPDVVIDWHDRADRGTRWADALRLDGRAHRAPFRRLGRSL